MILATMVIQADYDLVPIRTAYSAAAKDKIGLKRLQQYLKRLELNTSPVLTCYRGAAEMMNAKYAVNPLAKFSAFSKGKQLIESAISADSTCLECRFIRYGIQRNIPGILNYHDQIRADSLTIINGLDTLGDMDLKYRITSYLKNN